MKSDRDASIELLRAVLMFGICMLHCACKGATEYRHLTYSLLFAVDAFVLITGWYGVNLRIKKVVSLLGTTIYCLAVASFINWGMYGGGVISTAFEIWKGMWFVQGYILMLMFVPAVNSAIEGKDLKSTAMILSPILLLIFGWGWAATLPLARRVVPLAHGLEAYSGITLLGVYAFGRLMRKVVDVCPLKKRYVYLLSVIALGAAWFGFARYNSPLALFLSFAIFMLFKDIRLPDAFARAVFLLSPSLFSVYLMHANGAFGFRVIRDMTGACKGLTGCIITAAIVFVSAIVLDIPRRLAVCFARRFSK